MKKLRHNLPRKSMNYYKELLNDQPQNKSSCKKIESVQYKAALVITGGIKSTSRGKIYQELGLEFLKSKRW